MSNDFADTLKAIAMDPVYQFLALILLILVARLAYVRRPALRFASHILFFATLTALLVSNDIAPWAQDNAIKGISQKLFNGLAKATWWIGGAMVLVSSVRLFLTFELKPREGRLLQDLLVGVIYLGAGLSVIAFVFSLPVGTLIATSGVFAIVVGLALQSTLGDLFSGIALNINRPYGVGDWISLEHDILGRVVETNWRSTQILSKTNDIVIVPNSDLAKTRLVNFTGFDEAHGTTVTVRLLPTESPAVVEDMMKSVLLSANSILKSPPPTVAIKGLDALAIEAELSFRVPDITHVAASRNEIYDLVYRHVRAGGFRLALPVGSSTTEPSDQSSQHPGTAWRLLTLVPLFSTLTEGEKETLSATMQRLTFKKDAIIAPQDASMTSLMIVRSGVAVSEQDVDGQPVELARLAPGDLLGERGVLMGASETARIRALTFVVIYEISKDRLAVVMRDRPALAEELGRLLARRVEIEHHRSKGDDRSSKIHPISMTARIRRLFEYQR